MKKVFTIVLKIGVYFLCLSTSLFLAYILKYSFSIPICEQVKMWQHIMVLVPIKLCLLIALGEFKGIFSYFRLPDLVKIVLAFSAFSFILFLLRLTEFCVIIPTREIILSDLLFSILFILFFRASLRIINDRLATEDAKIHPSVLRVAIVGISEFSSQIISELKTKRFHGVLPVVALDDDPKYHGRHLHGIPILGTPEILSDLVIKENIGGVVFIASQLSQKRILELSELAKNLNLKTFTIPSIEDFFEGRAFATRMRPLDVEDFLERNPICLNMEQCAKAISNRVVCITGAGGSIGSELTRQIALKGPQKLILIDHSEYNLFKIEQDLIQRGIRCIPILLSIVDEAAVRDCLKAYRPSIIFHAAAYKHVPLLEGQPLIALRNNVLGTGILAQCAVELGVEKFVLISTDKAINPVNNMGATKRICEMLCMAMQAKANNKTQFMAVRFGNVLGSAGSVLPTFREQILKGGPVTVTHPKMTRFFMTIPEAVGLILEAFSFKNIAGNIYVLDMGKPVKIVDLAKRMIELSNLQVNSDIEIVYTGIRPGEKLHEDLVFDPKEILPTSNKLIGLFKCDKSFIKLMKPIQVYMDEIKKLTSDNDGIQFIREFIPEFKKY